MEKQRMINTGIYITEQQFERMKQIADILKVSNNRVVGILLEAAEVEAPKINVRLPSVKKEKVLA